MAWDPYREIDNYCERTDPSFWSEPLNAVTNAAFLIAAFLAWRAAAREGRLEWATWTLIALMATIGVGSFLFHTFANAWSMWADVIPIQIAILAYFYLVPVRFYGLPGWGGALGLLAAFAVIFALGSLLRSVVGPLNGSVGYLAVALTLAAMGAGLVLRDHPAGGGILAAMAVFGVSLTARTLDESLCGAVPAGLHWIWHSLNGLTLFLLTLALIRHGAPGAARASAARG